MLIQVSVMPTAGKGDIKISESKIKHANELCPNNDDLSSVGAHLDLEASQDQLEEQEVFQIAKQDGPNFRGVGTYGAAILIAKSQLALGVLGLPATLNTLGFLPGLICLCCLCFLCTYTGFTIGKFRNNHPHIYCIDDAAYMLFGKWARELMGVAFWIFYMLCYGSAVLAISIAFNALTEHPICTVFWVVIAAVISIMLGASIRTMKVLSCLGYFAMSSIVVAVWIVAVACLAQDEPAAAPKGEPINKMIRVASQGIPFKKIASAVAIQSFSLNGTASFFSI